MLKHKTSKINRRKRIWAPEKKKIPHSSKFFHILPSESSSIPLINVQNSHPQKNKPSSFLNLFFLSLSQHILLYTDNSSNYKTHKYTYI